MTSTTANLPLRRWGQTDLHVTSLCIGCAPLGSLPGVLGYSVTEEQALATLRAAFSSPITYLDTAGSYGESERRIGMVLHELGSLPAGCVLATKVGQDPGSGDFSGEQVKRSIERSLRLLGLEKLQIVFLHDPEYSNLSVEQVMGPGGPVETLLHYKAQGIIQHIGVAGGPIDLLMRYVDTDAFEAVLTHNRYTLLNRAAEPLLDLAARRGLAVINAAPYGGGLLSKGPDASPRYAYREAPSVIVERTRRMAAICQEYGVPLAAAALQFSLRNPQITSTIVGMSHAERVTQTLDLARHPISDAIWPQLDTVGFDTDDPQAT